MSAPARTQIRRGVGLAAAAALAFGATMPLLKLASAGVGVFTCGGLLYLGAAIAGFAAIAIRRRPGGAGPWRAPQLARLLGLAALGAVCAPALLVVGIKRTDAVTTSLLLTLEAPFTMLLARLLFHEHLGGRALAAAGLILAGARAGGRAVGRRRCGGPGHGVRRRRDAGLGAGQRRVAHVRGSRSAGGRGLERDAGRHALGLRRGACGRGAAVGRGRRGNRRDRRGRLRPEPRSLPARPGADRRGADRVRLRRRAVRRVGGRAGPGRAVARRRRRLRARRSCSPASGCTPPSATATATTTIRCGTSTCTPTTDGHHTHVHDPMPAARTATGTNTRPVTHEHEHGEDLHHRHHS